MSRKIENIHTARQTAISTSARLIRHFLTLGDDFSNPTPKRYLYRFPGQQFDRSLIDRFAVNNIMQI